MIINILESAPPDTLVVPLLQQPELAEQLAALARGAGIDPKALQNDFRAEAKEVFVLYAAGGKGKIYLVGLGKKLHFQTLSATLRAFCFRYKQKLPRRVGVDLRHLNPAQNTRLTDAAVSGMLLGLYQNGVYRTEAPPKPAPPFGQAKSQLDVIVPPGATKLATAAARRAEIFADITRQVFDLVNAPGNRLHPQKFCEWAVQAGKENGVQVRVLDYKALQKKGLEALAAVGRGSPVPPALVLLEYTPAKTGKRKIPCVGLVGKGITFDTGGISLKPSVNMHFMKSDMGGAAAVLGAILVAARLKLPVRMVGAVPVAENMIAPQALKPGDVIGSYAGKSIEVTDTDAEGRLILADGLAYLNDKEKPDVLIDIATLTGSVIRALGHFAAGLFTQNDPLAEALYRAGDTCGERLWRLPLWDDYSTDLRSDVADLRNFTGKPMAEAISAAKFIEHFTAQHTAWAHLDIAGTAFVDSEFGQTKNATGYGVRLLVEFVEGWIAKGG